MRPAASVHGVALWSPGLLSPYSGVRKYCNGQLPQTPFCEEQRPHRDVENFTTQEDDVLSPRKKGRLHLEVLGPIRHRVAVASKQGRPLAVTWSLQTLRTHVCIPGSRAIGGQLTTCDRARMVQSS